MTMKNKTNVLIDGRNFMVVGNGSKEYMQKLAAYVDKNIKEMTGKNNRLSSSMAAILAALNISDELFKSKEELESLKNRLEIPTENHNSILKQLKELKKANEELEISNKVYKDELLDTKKEKDRLNGDVKRLTQALEISEKELGNSKYLIEKLQDKIFDNQMQLIESKKELEEALKIYDRERNIFIKDK